MHIQIWVCGFPDTRLGTFFSRWAKLHLDKDSQLEIIVPDSFCVILELFLLSLFLILNIWGTKRTLSEQTPRKTHSCSKRTYCWWMCPLIDTPFSFRNPSFTPSNLCQACSHLLILPPAFVLLQRSLGLIPSTLWVIFQLPLSQEGHLTGKLQDSSAPAQLPVSLLCLTFPCGTFQIYNTG